MSFLNEMKETMNTVAAAATEAASKAAVAGKAMADTAIQQTKTIAAVGKVKLAIAGEEDKLKKAYTELGRLFYRDHAAQTEAEMEEYLPWIQRASDAKEAIERLNADLEALKAQKEAQEEAVEEEAEVPAEDAAAEETADSQPVEEDLSIFVDFADTAVAAGAFAEDAEAAPAEAKEEVPEVNLDESIPTVGTLYVDISGEE